MRRHSFDLVAYHSLLNSYSEKRSTSSALLANRGLKLDPLPHSMTLLLTGQFLSYKLLSVASLTPKRELGVALTIVENCLHWFLQIHGLYEFPFLSE